MNIRKNIKGIFIDLDGTLADSAPDLTTALNISLNRLGYPDYTLDKTRHWIGNGLDQLLHRALTNDDNGDAEPELLARAREGFFIAYEQVNGQRSTLFPGVEAALTRFNRMGISVACITNKSRRFSLQLLQHLNIDHQFSLVIGGDDVDAKKPAPDSIRKALEHYGYSADECLMIGDSDNDVFAANRAGVDVLCVEYGYSQGVNLAELEIAGMIHSMDDIQLTHQDGR